MSKLTNFEISKKATTLVDTNSEHELARKLLTVFQVCTTSHLDLDFSTHVKFLEILEEITNA